MAADSDQIELLFPLQHTEITLTKIFNNFTEEQKKDFSEKVMPLDEGDIAYKFQYKDKFINCVLHHRHSKKLNREKTFEVYLAGKYQAQGGLCTVNFSLGIIYKDQGQDFQYSPRTKSGNANIFKWFRRGLPNHVISKEAELLDICGGKPKKKYSAQGKGEIQVFSRGEEKRLQFGIIMRRQPGVTLEVLKAEHAKRDIPFDFQAKIKISRAILEAYQRLPNNVIHNDLSFGNILIHYNKATNKFHATIIDFGLSSLTTDPAVEKPGTLFFCAPELSIYYHLFELKKFFQESDKTLFIEKLEKTLQVTIGGPEANRSRDYWSIGCILAELFGVTKFIFHPLLGSLYTSSHLETKILLLITKNESKVSNFLLVRHLASLWFCFQNEKKLNGDQLNDYTVSMNLFREDLEELSENKENLDEYLDACQKKFGYMISMEDFIAKAPSLKQKYISSGCSAHTGRSLGKMDRQMANIIMALTQLEPSKRITIDVALERLNNINEIEKNNSCSLQ